MIFLVLFATLHLWPKGRKGGRVAHRRLSPKVTAAARVESHPCATHIMLLAIGVELVGFVAFTCGAVIVG